MRLIGKWPISEVKWLISCVKGPNWPWERVKWFLKSFLKGQRSGFENGGGAECQFPGFGEQLESAIYYYLNFIIFIGIIVDYRL